MDQKEKKEQRENKEEYAFITETIKDKPVNKRRLARKAGWTVLSGLLFGLAACVAFVAAKPKLETLMEPQPSGDPVTIPRDQLPEGDGEPGSGEEGQQGGAGEENPNTPEEGINNPAQEGNGSGAAEEPDDDEVPPAPIFIERDLEARDYQLLLNKLYAVGKQANRSVVTVTGVTSNIDWFDSAYESENQGSGIIIRDDGQELLILTERRVINNAEAINITFHNNDVAPAEVKKYDGNTGIAIISVKPENISPETLDKIEAVELGNSLIVGQGTVVIAIGSPLESNYSILTGTVTSSDYKVSAWDSDYTVFTTDIMGSSRGSGALINLNGEVVGLILQDYSSPGDRNTITALSISELKGLIEKLSNGEAIPYLGIKVSTVTEEISQQHGLPQGVYVKNVETEFSSPAMEAGLQEGDVITELNGEEMQTIEQYTQMLLSLAPEQSVKLKVQRQSGEGYTELECTAVVGVLK